MSKSMKKMLLLAAVQTDVGTAVVPTAAINALMVRGFTPEPLVADQVERNLIRPYKGNSGKLVAGEHRKFGFEIELAGSGSLGAAPAWGPVLMACGFAETITTAEKVEYMPVSEGEPVLTMYGYVDGTLFQMHDAKGTVSFDLTPKGIPVMKFNFLGTYVPPSEVAMPAGVDYSAFMQPLVVGKRNTPTLEIFGHAGCTSAFTVDWANELAWREMINCAGARSPDRKPSGSITMEFPKVSDKDWTEIIRQGQSGPLSIVHGVTPGNIVELQMPNIQPGPYTLQDDAGVAMMQMPFGINPSQGDDELTIIVR